MKYQSLISKMTLEEKASMLSGKDFWQSKDIKRLGIPSMFLSDGPHGIRKQAAAADHLGLNASIPATCYPTAATMANSWNDELAEKMATFLGEEAVSEKVNVLLGPGTNMKRNPLCGRNFEYFSEDPFLAGKMASSYVRGIQSNGISACVKHYAGNNQEERRLVSDSVIDERTLREIYCTAFEMAVKEGGVKTIMSAYNRINGVHVNENKHLMVDILRNDWGYKGVVVTDWGGNNIRVEGLKCGNELEMPTTCGETNKEVVDAIKNGELDEKVLDENIDRLLTLIFDTEEVYKKERKAFDVDAHHEMAEKCAEESIVLLQNNNKILPIQESKKVAVIGDFAKVPRYQGAGSSVVNPTKLDSPLESMGFKIQKNPKNPLPNDKDKVVGIGENEYGFEFIGFEKGFERYGKKNDGLIKKACKLAEKAEVVFLYIGLDEATEAEGLDRENMKLPQNQIDLINELNKTGKTIIAVLACGAAVEMDWADKVDAIVHSYLGGQAGARAVLNVICGKVNPSGKLSESYPYHYEDCPSATHFPGHELSVEYREGMFIGYRYFDTANVAVRYPFGFGMSYTTFEYSDIKATDKEVTFKIKNTGNVDGKEVAQIYVGLKDSKIFRPKKELKGFKKVFVKAGETVDVKISLDDKAFRYFNVKTDKWEIEGGNYTIFVGASSLDIKLTAEVAVQGTTDVVPYDAKQLPSYFEGKTADVSVEEFETLLGHKVPNPHFNFYKKNRMILGYNDTFAQLRYSKRWIGRFAYGALNLAHKFMIATGNRAGANVIIMGVYHQPFRGLSRMSGGMISWGQLDGILMMVNGHFFKGLGKFMKEGKIKKKAFKAAKQAEQAEEEKLSKGE